ncbi:OTU domain-containing protein [Streptomyces tubercidicus]|uniref:OTU domain-containing protein n=1 Tax=Streptomyces tubercidicus TaxID=47759 RepID=UPI002E16CAED
MTLHVSDEFRVIALMLTGSPLPNADEDALNAMGEIYGHTRRRLEQLPHDVVRVTQSVRDSFEMDTANAYAESVAQFTSGGQNYVQAGQEITGGLEKMAKTTAVNVEYMKIMAILQITEMLVEILIAIVTFQYERIPEIKAKAGISLQQLMRTLFQQLVMHVVINETIGVALDGLAQRIQMGKGTRRAWDKSLTKDAALGGLLDGLLEGPLSMFGGKVGNKLADLFGGTVAKDVAKQVSKDLSDTIDTATDATVNSLTHGIQDVITKNADDLLRPLGGSGQSKHLGAAAAKKLGDDFGDAFAHAFKDTLGEQAARDLGNAYGNAFAKSWGTESRQTLRDTLKNNGGGHIDPAVHHALAKLPETTLKSIRQHHDNVVTKSSHFAGMSAAVAGQGYLSEGFYNLLFSDEHSFKVSPVSGASAAFAEGATHGATIGGIAAASKLTGSVHSTAIPAPVPTASKEADSDTHNPATTTDQNTYPAQDTVGNGQQNTTPDSSGNGERNTASASPTGSGGTGASSHTSPSQSAPTQHNGGGNSGNSGSSGSNGGDGDGNGGSEPNRGHYDEYDDTASTHSSDSSRASGTGEPKPLVTSSSPDTDDNHHSTGHDDDRDGDRDSGRTAQQTATASATTTTTTTSEQTSEQSPEQSSDEQQPPPQKEKTPPPGSKWGELNPPVATEQHSPSVPHTPDHLPPHPVATEERRIVAEHVVAGEAYHVLRVPGNGDCLFTSVLVSAHRQNALPGIQHLSVQELRDRVAHHVRDTTDTDGADRAGYFHSDPVDVVLHDLIPDPQAPPGTLTPEQRQQLDEGRARQGQRRRDARALLDDGDGESRAAREKWQELLEPGNYPHLLHLAPTPRAAQRLGTGALIVQAASDTGLWNSPFADSLPQLVANALDVDVTIVENGQPPYSTAPHATNGPLYVFFERSGSHYQAMTRTVSDAPSEDTPHEQPGPSQQQAPAQAPAQEQAQQDDHQEEQHHEHDDTAHDGPADDDRILQHTHPTGEDGDGTPEGGPQGTGPKSFEVPYGFGRDGRYPLGQFGHVLRFGDIAFGGGGERPAGLHALVKSAIDGRPGRLTAKNRERLANQLSDRLWQELSGDNGQVPARQLFDEGGVTLTAPVGRFSNPYTVTLRLADVDRNKAEHLNPPPQHASSATPATGAAKDTKATRQLLHGERDKGQREASVNYNTGDSTTVSNNRSISLTTTHPSPADAVAVKPKITLTGSASSSKGHSNQTNTYVRPELNFAGTREHFGFDGASLSVGIRRTAGGPTWTGATEGTLEVSFPTELTDPQANHTGHPWGVQSGGTQKARRKLAEAVQSTFFIAQDSYGQAPLAAELTKPYASMGPDSGPRRLLDNWFSEHSTLWTVHRMLSGTALPSFAHKGTHYTSDVRSGVTSVRRLGDATEVGVAGNTRDWNSVFHTTSKGGGKSVNGTVVIGPDMLPLSFSAGFGLGTGNSASLTEGYTGGMVNTTRFNGPSVPYELTLNVEAGLNPVGRGDFSHTRETVVVIRVPEHLADHFEQQLATVAREGGGRVTEEHDAGGEHSTDRQQHTPPPAPPSRGLFGVFGLRGLAGLPQTFLHAGRRAETLLKFEHSGVTAEREYRQALKEFLTTQFHPDQMSHLAPDVLTTRFHPDQTSHRAPDVLNGGVRRTFRGPEGKKGRLLLHFGVAARPARPGEEAHAWRLPVKDATVQKWPTNWAWLSDSQGQTSSQSFTIGGTLSGEVTHGLTLTAADALFSRGRDHTRSDGVTTYGFSHMGANASGEMWHDSYPVVFELSVDAAHVSGTTVLDEKQVLRQQVDGRADYLVPKSLTVEDNGESTGADAHRVTSVDVEPQGFGRNKTYPPLKPPQDATENRIRPHDRIDHVHGARRLQREAAEMFRQVGIPRQDAVPYVETLLTPDQLKGILNRDAQASSGRLVREKRFTDNDVQFVVQAITVNDKTFGDTQELSNFTLDEGMSRFTGTDKTVRTNSHGLGISLSGTGENGERSGGGSGDASGSKAVSHGKATVTVTDIHPGQFVDQTLPHRQHEADVIWRLSVIQRDTNMLGSWGEPQTLVRDVHVEGGVSYLRPEFTHRTAHEAKVPERLAHLPLTAMTVDLAPRTADDDHESREDREDGGDHEGREPRPRQDEALPRPLTGTLLHNLAQLLQKNSPSALGPAHHLESPGTTLTSRGDTLFDSRTLQSLSSVLRGTGVHVRMRTDGFGHHTYTHVIAQLTRDDNGARFTGKTSKGMVSRYTQSHTRSEVATTHTVKNSVSAGGSSSGGLGSNGASPSLSFGTSKSTSLSNSDAIMIRRHDAYSTPEEELYVYEVDGTIDLAVESAHHASQLVNALLLGRAAALKSGADALWQYVTTHDDGSRTLSLPVREEVVVARSELPPALLKEAEQHDNADAEDVPGVRQPPWPQPPAPIGKDEFRDHGVLVDMNESASRKLFDDLMKKLSEHGGAPQKFAEKGQAGREQLRQLLNSRELAWHLHRSGLGGATDKDGTLAPRLTTEAGVMTLTYGKLRVTFTQLGLGSPDGWVKGTAERSDYRFQYNTQSHATGKDAGIGGGVTANFAAATGKMTQGMSGTFRQGRTESHDSGGFTSRPTVSVDRTVHWLRHGPTAVKVDVQLSADSNLDRFDLGTFTLDDVYQDSFVLDDMLQLRYSPEAVLREVGGITEAAIRVDSGWYLAPHHANEQHTATMLEALHTAQETAATEHGSTWHVTGAGDGHVRVRDQLLSRPDFIDRYVRPHLTPEQYEHLGEQSRWEGADTDGSPLRFHVDTGRQHANDAQDANEPNEPNDEAREEREQQEQESPHTGLDPDPDPDPSQDSPLLQQHTPQVPSGFGRAGHYPLGQFGRLLRVGEIPFGAPGRRPDALKALVRSAIVRSGTSLKDGSQEALAHKLADDVWRQISGTDGPLLARKLLSEEGLKLDLGDDRQSKYRATLRLGALSREHVSPLPRRARGDGTGATQLLPYGAKIKGHREAVLNRQAGGTHSTGESRSLTSSTTVAPPALSAAVKPALKITGTSSASHGQSFLTNSYDRPEVVLSGDHEHFAFRDTALKLELIGVPKAERPGRSEQTVAVEVSFPRELTRHEANHTDHDWEVTPRNAAERRKLNRALQDLFFLPRESSGQDALVPQLTGPYPGMGPGTRARGFLDSWFGEMATIANFSRMLSSTKLTAVHSQGHLYASEVRVDVRSVKRAGDPTDVGLANNVRMWKSVFHSTSKGGSKAFELDLTVGPDLSDQGLALAFPFSFGLSGNDSMSLTEGSTGGTLSTVRFNGKSVPYEVLVTMEAGLTQVGAPAMPSKSVPVRVVVHVPEHLAGYFEYRLAHALGNDSAQPPRGLMTPPPNPPEFGLYEGFGVCGLTQLVDHFRHSAVTAEKNVGFTHRSHRHRTQHLEQLNRFLEVNFHVNELSRNTTELFGDGIHLTFLGPRGDGGTQLLLHFEVKGTRHHGGDGDGSAWRLPVGNATVQNWPTHWNWLAMASSMGNGQSLSAGFGLSESGGGLTFTPADLSFSRERDVSLTNSITTYAFAHSGTNASGPMWHDSYPATYDISVYAEKVTGSGSSKGTPLHDTRHGGVQYLVPKSLADLPLAQDGRDQDADTPPPVPQRAPAPTWNGRTLTFAPVELPAHFVQERLQPSDRVDHAYHARAVREAAAGLMAELNVPPYVASYLQHLVTTDQLKGALHSESNALPGRFVVGHQFADTHVYLVAQAVTGNRRQLAEGTQELSTFGLNEYMLRYTQKTQVTTANGQSAGTGMAYEGTNGDTTGDGSLGFTASRNRSTGRAGIEVDDTHPGQFFEMTLPNKHHAMDVVWQLNVAVTQHSMLGTWQAKGLSSTVHLPGGATFQRPEMTVRTAEEAGVPGTLRRLPVMSMTTGLSPVTDRDREGRDESTRDRSGTELSQDEQHTALPPTLTHQVISNLVTLLAKAAPGTLGPVHSLNEPGSALSSMGDSILDGGSLRTLASLLLDTGLTIRVRTDGVGHHTYVDVSIRMDRDPADARFAGKTAPGVLSRYLQSNTRVEEQFTHGSTSAKGLSLGGSGTKSQGGSASAALQSSTSASTSHNSSVIIRRHDGYTTSEEDLCLYRADGTLTLSVETSSHASQLVNALLLGKARVVKASIAKATDWLSHGSAAPHEITLPVREDVLVPRSELPDPLIEEREPLSPIGTREFQRHDVLVDMDETAAPALFTELMARLAGHPGGPGLFADPAHGGHTQLRHLMGAREMARHVVRAGLGTPTTQTSAFRVRLSAEGGVATFTHGQLSVSFVPRYQGYPDGWHKGTGERADYDMQNDIDASVDSRGTKVSGGVTGTFGGPVSQGLSFSSALTRSLEHDSGGQLALQKNSVDRTVHWLRHEPTSVDLVVKLSTYDTFDRFGLPKISGKDVFEETFTLTDALQLRFSPEAVLRGTGGVRENAVRVDSGWYFPPHRPDEADPAQLDAMLDALLTAQETAVPDDRQTWHLTATDDGGVLVRGERLSRQEFADRYVRPLLSREQAYTMAELVHWEGGGAGAALLLHLGVPADMIGRHGPRPQPPTPSPRMEPEDTTDGVPHDVTEQKTSQQDAGQGADGLKKWADALNVDLDQVLQKYS